MFFPDGQYLHFYWYPWPIGCLNGAANAVVFCLPIDRRVFVGGAKMGWNSSHLNAFEIWKIYINWHQLTPSGSSAPYHGSHQVPMAVDPTAPGASELTSARTVRSPTLAPPWSKKNDNKNTTAQIYPDAWWFLCIYNLYLFPALLVDLFDLYLVKFWWWWVFLSCKDQNALMCHPWQQCCKVLKPAGWSRYHPWSHMSWIHFHTFVDVFGALLGLEILRVYPNNYWRFCLDVPTFAGQNRSVRFLFMWRQNKYNTNRTNGANGLPARQRLP